MSGVGAGGDDGVGPGGEKVHGGAVAEVFDPVIAALVLREDVDGFDVVAPGGGGGDVRDEGEGLLG